MSVFQTLVTVSLIVFCSNAFGKDSYDRAPVGFAMSSPNQESYLNMDCSYVVERGAENKNKIKCDFDQILLRKIDLKKEISELNTYFGTLKAEDKSKMLKDMKLCKKSLQEGNQKIEKFKNIIETKLNTLKKGSEVLAKYCACGDGKKEDDIIKCYQNVSIDDLKQRVDQCIMSQNKFEMEFTKVSKTKWISNPGPKGSCGFVTVTELVSAEESPNLWTYKQVRAARTSEDEGCKAYDLNVQTVFSWEYPSTSTINCSSITIGI